MARTAAPASSATSSSSSTASVISSSSHSSVTEPVASPVSTENKFKCNHCELIFKNDKGLKIHIGKTHKSCIFKTPEKERSISVSEEPILTLTPEIGSREEEDEEVVSHNEKLSQTEVTNKDSKVQTDTTDTSVTVKWEKSGKLTLPPGTVVLRYEDSDLKEIPLDYPVMSPPATLVYHPLWGLGKYCANDEEHIFYKFKGNGRRSFSPTIL